MRVLLVVLMMLVLIPFAGFASVDTHQAMTATASDHGCPDNHSTPVKHSASHVCCPGIAVFPLPGNVRPEPIAQTGDRMAVPNDHARRLVDWAPPLQPPRS